MNYQKIKFTFSTLLTILIFHHSGVAQIYFPERGEKWATVTPSLAGFDPMKLEKAIGFIESNEYSGSRDLRIAILEGFRREPFHSIQGKTKKRKGPAGMILKRGKIVAKWGDTQEVEMTFSCTKSYLSTVVGLAIDDKLISSTNDYLYQYVWDGHFDGHHNSKITWAHLLTQSSDWYGVFMGIDDWSDRPPKEGDINDWARRPLNEPGTVYEYNDTRVNLLAFATLQVLRKPLPQILKERIMDPIGASSTWQWHGYDDSWTILDGLHMQSVSGGGHHGGGLFISTEDHARFGLLFMNDGIWNGNQLISKPWIAEATRPSIPNNKYGYMWWLNTLTDGEKTISNAPETMYYAAGFGGNYVIIDSKNELVIVTRWLEPSKFKEAIEGIYDAIK